MKFTADFSAEGAVFRHCFSALPTPATHFLSHIILRHANQTETYFLKFNKPLVD
uniref:Uncharacterized protein n=1 Tax=Anguilla anguilla TaxID=7936 RepID=A0A0E9P755_ANGAN